MGYRAAKILETLALASGQLSEQAALEQKEASPGSPLCKFPRNRIIWNMKQFFQKKPEILPRIKSDYREK